MSNFLTSNSSPASATLLLFSPQQRTSASLPIQSNNTIQKKNPSKVDEAIQNAVYGHIQAIRALGRTKVNTADIARALSVSVKEVDQAIVALRGKGVKPAKK